MIFFSISGIYLHKWQHILASLHENLCDVLYIDIYSDLQFSPVQHLWLMSVFVIWGLWCQKQVSRAKISNCIPQYSVGCAYLSMHEIPASGTKVLMSFFLSDSVCQSFLTVSAKIDNNLTIMRLPFKCVMSRNSTVPLLDHNCVFQKWWYFLDLSNQFEWLQVLM